MGGEGSNGVGLCAFYFSFYVFISFFFFFVLVVVTGALISGKLNGARSV